MGVLHLARRVTLDRPETADPVRARARAVRTMLASRRLPVVLAVATAVALLPALWIGLVVDDFFQRLAVEGVSASSSMR